MFYNVNDKTWNENNKTVHVKHSKKKQLLQWMPAIRQLSAQIAESVVNKLRGQFAEWVGNKLSVKQFSSSIMYIMLQCEPYDQHGKCPTVLSIETVVTKLSTVANTVQPLVANRLLLSLLHLATSPLNTSNACWYKVCGGCRISRDLILK